MDPQVREQQLKMQIQNLTKALDFTRCGLQTVPVALIEFTALQELRLTRNELTHIPDPVYEIGTLRKLFADHNQISQFPVHLNAWPFLAELRLSYNLLVSVPPSVAALQSITRLDLSHNKLQNLPNELGLLTTLQKLNVSYNQIVKLPVTIGELKKLRLLNFSFNQLEHFPNTFRNWRSVKNLSIQGNPKLALNHRYLTDFIKYNNSVTLDVEIPNSKELRRGSKGKLFHSTNSRDEKESRGRSKASSLTHAGDMIGLRSSPFRKSGRSVADSAPSNSSVSLQKRCKSDGYEESTTVICPDTPEPEKKELGSSTFSRTSKWLRKTINKDPSNVEFLPAELQQGILWEGKELLGASLEQLLALLSYDSELRSLDKFQKQFITVYRSFMTHEELLKYLVERFQAPLTSNLRKQRLLEALGIMIQYHKASFTKESGHVLLHELMVFIETNVVNKKICRNSFISTRKTK